MVLYDKTVETAVETTKTSMHVLYWGHEYMVAVRLVSMSTDYQCRK